MAEHRTSRPSSGRRALRALLLVVAVLLVLWGADAVARVGAQSVAARRLQSAAGLSGRPEVHVRGLLFLPQLLGGRYGHVDVDLDELTRQGLRLSPASAALFGVQVPFRDLVGGTVDRVVVDRTAGQATIGYEDLNRYLQQQGTPLTVSAAADGQAHVDGTVTVAGQSVQLGGNVTLTLADGKIRVTPSGAAGQPLAFTLPLGDLPYGQRLAAVHAGPDGLEVDVAGDDVVLQR